ncbi:MAG: GTP-binding protein [Candidatus Hodarchaeales archaeon]
MSSTMYKITLLGEGAVGKTALCNQFMGKLFSADYHMTIGADVFFKDKTVEGKEIKFQIWDLAGQPRFEIVQPPYYRGALGALLVFDVTRPESLERIPQWVERLWEFSGKGKVPIVLLGNKVDLRRIPSVIALQPEHGYAVAKRLSEASIKAGFAVPYLETSAKTGRNVEDAFLLLAKSISQFIQRQLAASK